MVTFGKSDAIEFKLANADSISVTVCSIAISNYKEHDNYTCYVVPCPFLHAGSQELEVYFVNNTPVVTKDRIYAEFESNRPGVSLLCHLIRFDNTKEDCTFTCVCLPS